MKTKKNISCITCNSITSIIVFIIAFAIFSIIAHEVVTEKEDWFDSSAFAFFNGYFTNFSIQFFKILTFFGSGTVLFTVYTIIIVWLIYIDRKADALDIALLAITSSLLLHVLKISFARHRPELPLLSNLGTYSFPSGHTLSSLVFFSVVTWIVWQSATAAKWKWIFAFIFILLSMAIGISRIVLRYHYASDVLAGFCLGLAYVVLFFWLRKVWRRNY